MKKKTILVAAIAVMLVAALVVGGTLAYFTDKTEAKQNTFTVGSVGIDLTEDKWNAADDHTLVPGAFYDKNPTITVKDNSQDAYVFLKLDLNKYVSLINLMGVDAYKNIDSLKGSTYPGFIAFVEKLATDNPLRAAVLDRWFVGVNHADWKVMNLAELKADVAAAKNGRIRHTSLLFWATRRTAALSRLAPRSSLWTSSACPARSPLPCSTVRMLTKTKMVCPDPTSIRIMLLSR